MSREIKFRAWDIEENCWIKSWDIFDKEQDNIRGQVIHKYCYHESDMFINMFTGVKDKNGVEIYDGDILRLSDETNPLHYYQVKYVENLFALDGELAIHIESAYFKEREVIGNIYENGDLLK